VSRLPVRRVAVCGAVALAALTAAAPAWAHGRGATVALDYRVTVASPPASGVRASILDGDRSLRLQLAAARTLVVLGDLREPMLRFREGVWEVNESSPTAQADRLVVHARPGWRQVARGSAFAWHEHRLAPPPYSGGSFGPVARWSVPLVVDGRRTAVGGVFERVRRPRWWLWLGATLVLAAAAGAALARGPGHGAGPAVAAVVVAGAAAILCQTAFVLRDSPTGRVPWVGVGLGLGIAVVSAGLLAASRGPTRAYVAGAIGAGVAALTLSWVGVFFHGAVVAALPGAGVRIACAAALGAGLVALAGSLTVHGDTA
jgi:hypothetical protein